MRQKEERWTELPEVVSARRSILAHYDVLGCPPGSSRLDSLIAHVEGPGKLHSQLRCAHEAFATKPRSPETIAALAKTTWVAFNEPVADTLEQIDRLGLAHEYGVALPGSFGRLWCRRITDAAWTIWTLASLYDRRMTYLEPNEEWLEDLRG